MPHNQINIAAAQEVLDRIKRTQRAHEQAGAALPYRGQDFESDVRDLLESLLPFSTLSGLRLFSATHRLGAPRPEEVSGDEPEADHTFAPEDNWGFEMDHLFHFRCNGDDFIVLIETKNQPVKINGDQWEVEYERGPKCAKEQVNNHIKVLWEYLEPVSKETHLRFIAIVCSVGGAKEERAAGHRDAELHSVSVENLPQVLEAILAEKGGEGGYPFEVFRVRESGILNLLRMSLPIKELGHPELSSAIRYVERCRRSVDEALFRHFEPKPERWVINGSAGMGKSVLLAYTAAVFSTGHGIAKFQGKSYIHIEKKLERLKLAEGLADQSIVVVAMSGKQLENLKGWFLFFVNRFRDLDEKGVIRVRQPEFVLCRDGEEMRRVCERATALMVDEAHDLPEFAAKVIAEAHPARGFYLAVACDRHQKLRLSKDDARIIRGLDFTNKSKRLKQIYRNPVSIYIVSLALMFRWGARTGPKVLPTWGELRDWFGFEVKRLPGQGHKLSIMSDAHPANSWCHNVVMFPSAAELYDALESEQLSGSDVLWVRFSEEDPDFDYEKLSRFTYHNCRTFEAQEISDKYVKGQEFAVVVIEGFPSFVDKFDESGAPSSEEEKMWAFRREIYLCASRATCFLYFLSSPRRETAENVRFRDELKAVIDSVAAPELQQGGGTRKWSIFVTPPSFERKLDVFEDSNLAEDQPEVAVVVAHVDQPRDVPVVDDQVETVITHDPVVKSRRAISLTVPLTVKELAEALGVKPFQIAKDLMSLDVFAGVNQMVNAEQAKQVAANYDVELEVKRRPDRAAVEVKPPAQPATATVQKQQPTRPQIAPATLSRSYVELTPDELSKLPTIKAFDHTISIDGPMSVMELARRLGVPHRQIINTGTRLKRFLRGGTLMGPKMIARIASERGFGVKVEEAKVFEPTAETGN